MQIKRYSTNEAKRFMWWLSVGQIYKRAPPLCMFTQPLLKSDQSNPINQTSASTKLPSTPSQSLSKVFRPNLSAQHTNPVTHSGFYFCSATSRPLPDVEYINLLKPKRNVPIGRHCCEVKYWYNFSVINEWPINTAKKLEATI